MSGSEAIASRLAADKRRSRCGSDVLRVLPARFAMCANRHTSWRSRSAHGSECRGERGPIRFVRCVYEWDVPGVSPIEVVLRRRRNHRRRNSTREPRWWREVSCTNDDQQASPLCRFISGQASRAVSPSDESAEDARSVSELRDEPRIVLEQETNIRDVVAEHQHALDAHSEGKTGVLLGVDAALGEHIGVNHPAAEDL
jgi:hypothetical protein